MSECDLYRAFDCDGRLLYVGVSVNAFGRFRDHRRRSSWASETIIMAIERLPSREIAEWEERRAIREQRPIWNRKHLPKLPKLKRKPPKIEPTKGVTDAA